MSHKVTYVIDHLNNVKLLFGIQCVQNDILFKVNKEPKVELPALSLKQMYKDGLLTEDTDKYPFKLFHQIMGNMIVRGTFKFEIENETLAVTFKHDYLPSTILIRVNTPLKSEFKEPEFESKKDTNLDIKYLSWPTDTKVYYFQSASKLFNTRQQVINSLSPESLSAQYCKLSDAPGISEGSDQIWYLKRKIFEKCPLIAAGTSDSDVKKVVDEFGNGFQLSETHDLIGVCDASDVDNTRCALNNWADTDKSRVLIYDSDAAHTSMCAGDIIKTHQNKIIFADGNGWYKIKQKKKCKHCSSHILFTTCKICSRCKSARYCSRKCQKIHWKNGHRV